MAPGGVHTLPQVGPAPQWWGGGGKGGKEGRFLATGIERGSAPCLKLQGMWWHHWDSKPDLYCFISCSLFSSVLLSKEELS